MAAASGLSNRDVLSRFFGVDPVKDMPEERLEKAFSSEGLHLLRRYKEPWRERCPDQSVQSKIEYHSVGQTHHLFMLIINGVLWESKLTFGRIEVFHFQSTYEEGSLVVTRAMQDISKSKAETTEHVICRSETLKETFKRALAAFLDNIVDLDSRLDEPKEIKKNEFRSSH